MNCIVIQNRVIQNGELELWVSEVHQPLAYRARYVYELVQRVGSACNITSEDESDGTLTSDRDVREPGRAW
jgi:hypothetical protein